MYRAKIGFSGLITMRKDEVRDIKDKNIIKDLLNANYIELVEEKPEKQTKSKK